MYIWVTLHSVFIMCYEKFSRTPLKVFTVLKYSLNVFRALTEEDAVDALSKFITNSYCYGRSAKNVIKKVTPKEITPGNSHQVQYQEFLWNWDCKWSYRINFFSILSIKFYQVPFCCYNLCIFFCIPNV